MFVNTEQQEDLITQHPHEFTDLLMSHLENVLICLPVTESSQEPDTLCRSGAAELSETVTVV